MMSKRKRDPTFAASEKTALIGLVEKYCNVIECKKTDALSMKVKMEKWQEICQEFNAISSVHQRSAAVLKNCWDNMKKRAKQEQTSRIQCVGTGEGPPKKIIDDPATDKVLELISFRVSGYVKSQDSNGTQILGTKLKSASKIQGMEESEKEFEVETSSDNLLEYAQKTLKTENTLMRSPTPEPEQPHIIYIHRPNSTTSSISRNLSPGPSLNRASRRKRIFKQSRLIKQRLDTLSMANTHAAEEHEITMNILRLQEKRELEILTQEKLRTMQEEIKLGILKIEYKKLKTIRKYLFHFSITLQCLSTGK